MQKIHILIHTLNHSGLVHSAVMLANGLAKNEYDVNLVVVGEKSKSPYEIDERIGIEFLNVKRGGGAVGKIRYLLQSASRIRKYIKSKKAKNIFVWGKEFTSVVVFLRMFTFLRINIIGVNVISILAHLNNNKGKLTRFVHLLIYKLVLGHADHVIAQSNGMVSEITDIVGVDKNKVSVAYPALSSKFYEVEVNNDRHNEILFIGRLAHQKNPEKCLNAFAKIKYKDVSLRFLGDGDLMPKLQDMAKNVANEHKVLFEGSQDNVVPYLQKAKLLVLSSRYEGFGMVLAEAAACGTPVVSVDCPVGPSEIVENGVNGYLVDMNNDNEFVSSIDKALDTQWDYNDIPKTVSKFHPDNVLPDYIKVIDKVFD